MPNWLQKRQILDFVRSVFNAFWLDETENRTLNLHVWSRNRNSIKMLVCASVYIKLYCESFLTKYVIILFLFNLIIHFVDDSIPDKDKMSSLCLSTPQLLRIWSFVKSWPWKEIFCTDGWICSVSVTLFFNQPTVCVKSVKTDSFLSCGSWMKISVSGSGRKQVC